MPVPVQMSATHLPFKSSRAMNVAKNSLVSAGERPSEPELLAHHAGKEPPHRVRLPAGGFHDVGIVAPFGRRSSCSNRACLVRRFESDIPSQPVQSLWGVSDTRSIGRLVGRRTVRRVYEVWFLPILLQKSARGEANCALPPSCHSLR